MVEEARRAEVLQDIVLLEHVGLRPVIVHGGGPEISGMMRQLGKEPVFVNGLRVTDAETADIAQMVLSGKTNPDLVAAIQQQGGRAIGLSGKDAGMVLALQAVRARRPGVRGRGRSR